MNIPTIQKVQKTVEIPNVQYIKTGKNEVASLKATIEEESANIQKQTSTIEELAGGIAADEADLKVAAETREHCIKVWAKT